MKASALPFLLSCLVFVGVGCRQTAPLVFPDGQAIYPEVALTPSQQAQGLSGRQEIGDGMLFCFAEAKQRSFWMLNMQRSIDMIWLRDGVVVDVSAEVPILENGNWARRMPSASANAVLEVEAGVAENKKLAVGQKFTGIDEACARTR